MRALLPVPLLAAGRAIPREEPGLIVRAGTDLPAARGR
jgi:hypothetical protein